MTEKGKLLYEYPNFKTRWIWVGLLFMVITIQIGWIVIFSVMIIGNMMHPFDYGILFFILILEICPLLILFLAYEESNSFGTKFQIYDEGFVSPRRTFLQYLRNEVNYIPFNQIKKIKIETYKDIPKYNYIKFINSNDRNNLRFLFSMIGFEKGLKILESTLKEKNLEIWENREIINN